MKLLLFHLVSLSLYSCAEVSLQAKGLNAVPPIILHIIGSYLKNPVAILGSLNRHFYSTYPVKLFLKDHMDIPELLTSDVKENEPELKHLLPFIRFSKNPDHLYQALRNEFLTTDNFNTLLPHLMNYFYRFKGNDAFQYDHKEKSNLFQRKNMDRILECDCSILKHFLPYISDEGILNNKSRIQSNPELMEEIQNQRNSLLSLHREFPVGIFLGSDIKYFINLRPSYIFLTGSLVPKDKYTEMFNAINSAINEASSEIRHEYYYLLNLIRYGPEDPNIYNLIEKLKSRQFRSYEMVLICCSASLADKMDLFVQLLPETSQKIISCSHTLYIPYHSGDKKLPISFYKFFFDLHEYSGEGLLRTVLYKETIFDTIVAKFYKVVSLDWNKYEVKILFEPKIELFDSGLPQQLLIRRTRPFDFLRKLPSKFTFGNSAIFSSYFFGIFNDLELSCSRFVSIEELFHGENLKFIVESIPVQNLLRSKLCSKSKCYPPLEFSLKALLKVVDEPVVPLGDLIRLDRTRNIDLYDFKTDLQLERLEILLGINVVTLLKHLDDDYFKCRHVYSYIIRRGQKHLLKRRVSDDKLFEIDFPGI